MTDAEVDQMQDDLVALLKAWSDRGIHPHMAAEFITGTGHMLLRSFGCPLHKIIETLTESWLANGGTP